MMMTKKTDPNSVLLNVIWGLYFILMACVVILIKGVFKKVFPGESMYIPAVLVMLGSWILSLIIFKRFSASKSIVGSILTVCLIFLSIYWVFFAAALPETDLNIHACSTWDCVLLQELESGAMLDSWVTTPIGLMMMVITQFSLVPSLLFMITRLTNITTSQNDPKGTDTPESPRPVSLYSLLAMALASFLIGGIEVYLPNFVAVSSVAGLYLLLSLVVFAVLVRIPSALPEQSNQQTQNSAFQINPLNMFVYLLFLAGFIIFVFSFADIKGYPLQRIWQFGVGILLFVVFFIVMISKDSQTYHQLIVWLNKAFFFVLLIASIQATHFYFSRSVLVLEAGLSPVISGFLLACFSIRMMLFVNNSGPVEKKGIALKKIPSANASLFILNLILALIFVVSLFEIFPRDRDAFITFLPGIAIGLIGFLLSMVKRR